MCIGACSTRHLPCGLDGRGAMAKTPGTEAKKASDPRRAENGHDAVQRNVLPIPDVTPIGLTTFDAKDPDTKYPPIRLLRPPAGAPNVLVVLIDDAGFG